MSISAQSPVREMLKHMTARERIEAEFGEPLVDVISTLREMRCSWRSVALALEVSVSTVRDYRRQLGLPIDGTRVSDELSWYPRKAELAAKRLGYRNAEEAVVDLRLSGKTVDETAAIMGINEKSVRRHYPPGFAGTVFVKTKRYVRTRRRGCGPWGQPGGKGYLSKLDR